VTGARVALAGIAQPHNQPVDLAAPTVATATEGRKTARTRQSRTLGG
jgi:hypothetical protein